MSDFTEKDRLLLQETYQKVGLMEQTLNGNGKRGLCDDVQRNSSRLTKVELLLAFAGGTGLVTGGVFGIQRLIG